MGQDLQGRAGHPKNASGNGSAGVSAAHGHQRALLLPPPRPRQIRRPHPTLLPPPRHGHRHRLHVRHRGLPLLHRAPRPPPFTHVHGRRPIHRLPRHRHLHRNRTRARRRRRTYPRDRRHRLHLSVFPCLRVRLGRHALALPSRGEQPIDAHKGRRARDGLRLALQLLCRADHAPRDPLFALGLVSGVCGLQR